MTVDNFKCKICGSSSRDVISAKVRDSNEHSVYNCKECAHVQLFPLPEWSENKNFYSQNKQANWVRPVIDVEKMRNSLKTDTIRRADFIEKLFTKDQKILELGTGYGFFMEEMLKRGWNIEGSEIGASRREIAENITGKSLFEFDVCVEDDIILQFLNTFDVVVAFQVFEHVLGPVEFLKGIKKLLKPEGKVIIEIPNRDDHMVELSPGYRNFYFQKAHVSYFNSSDLEKLLAKSGFNAVETHFIQRYSVENAMSWLIANAPQIEAPSFFCRPDLIWLDDFYREQLCLNGESDTLITIGQ